MTQEITEQPHNPPTRYVINDTESDIRLCLKYACEALNSQIAEIALLKEQLKTYKTSARTESGQQLLECDVCGNYTTGAYWCTRYMKRPGVTPLIRHGVITCSRCHSDVLRENREKFAKIRPPWWKIAVILASTLVIGGFYFYGLLSVARALASWA